MNTVLYLAYLCAIFTLLACEEFEKEEENSEKVENTEDFKVENGVYVLTQDNFDEFINSKDTVLVEFYAPWCGHCKSLAPEYDSAAEELKDDTRVALVKVDATVEKELAQRFEVSGYPTLMLFKRGVQMEYDGPRNKDGIVQKLQEVSDPSWTPPKEATVVLTNDNFTAVAQKEELLIVMFYAPWCGHCKTLKPEYEKAAKQLLLRTPPILLAKVDATVEKEVASKYKVQGYPTLKVFRKGRDFEFKSEAREKWGLVSYIEKLTEAASLELKNFQELKKILASGDDAVVPVAFYDKKDHPLSDIYFNTANSMRDELPFHHSFDSKLATSLDLPPNCLVLFLSERLHTKHEPAKRSMPIEEDSDSSALAHFIQQHRLPLLGEYSSSDGEALYKTARPLVMFFYSVDWSFEHRKATQMWRQKFADIAIGHPHMTFVVVDEESNADLFKQFGFDESSEDLNIGILAEGDRKYPMAEIEEYDREEIEEFIKEFNEGKLKARVKSQPKPSKQHSDVIAVVGKTFEEVVLDQSKDVLIELYAPWCGHCKKMEPMYKQLATKLKQEKLLVVAKMDATANDSPPAYSSSGFPTIYFALSNNKGAPMKFEGERTLEALEEFVRKHSTVAFKAPKQEL